MVMVSTRGRYALRVMLDLAEHYTGDTGEYTSLMDIAGRQGISEKYLESIIASLSRGGCLQAVRGRGGGYRLARQPEEYTVGEILRLTENALAPVACLEKGAEPCERADQCQTRPVWLRLQQLIGDYLDSVTLADLMKQPEQDIK